MPSYKDKLLSASDRIFFKKDPLKTIEPLICIPFTQYINLLDITAALSKLLIIEENIGYCGKSTFNRAFLYIHGWIWAFIDANDYSYMGKPAFRKAETDHSFALLGSIRDEKICQALAAQAVCNRLY